MICHGHKLGTILLALYVCLGCAARSRQQEVPSPDVGRRPQPSTLVQRARAHAAAGDTLRAEQYFTAALAQGAAPSEVLPGLLQVLLHGGRLRTALKYVEPQLKTDPGCAKLRYLAATIYLGLGRPRDALGELGHLLQLHPGHADGRYLAGAIAMEVYADEAATSVHFERYLDVAPRGPHAPEVAAWLRARAQPRAHLLSAMPELLSSADGAARPEAAAAAARQAP